MKLLEVGTWLMACGSVAACGSGSTNGSSFNSDGGGLIVDPSMTTGSGGQGSIITNEAGATGGSEGIGIDGGCGLSQISASNIPVNVLLVIDKSASMKDQPTGFPSDKWSALQAALSAALDQVKATISFGIEFFPNPPELTNPMQTCFVPSGASAIGIPIGPGSTTVPTILKAIQSTAPAGGTPTAAALQRAYEYFTTGAAKALTGNRYVLLATDGGPDCNSALTCGAATCTINLDGHTCGPPRGNAPNNCCDSNVGGPNAPGACLDDAGTVAAINALRTAGVRTFVVGIPGSEAYASYLDAFAEAGGETNPAGPPKYFAVTASGGVAGLTAVLSSITKQLVTTCNLQLKSVPPDLSKLNVSVDGKVVPQAGPDGWALDTATSPPTVILKGATCSKIEMSGADTVQVVYGCPTVQVN
jgi:hypothetical protein